MVLKNETKRMNSNKKNWNEATRLVHEGSLRSQFFETSEALFLTSGYVYPSPEDAEEAFKGNRLRYVYSRYSNPTVTMFENRLAKLEGANWCVATASGMAACFSILASQLVSGDRLVASKALFGSCLFIITELLPRYGIQTTLVDGKELNEWKNALKTKTKCVFVETPSNPTLDIIDLSALSQLTHKAGACLIVDNAFASPLLQKPLDLGADIVMYSATKHIDGQGRTLGGAILSNNESLLTNNILPWMRHTGPALSPFNAWVLLKGLETLNLRVSKATENATKLATLLSNHPKISKLLYPGHPTHPQHDLATEQMKKGGTIVTFEVRGGKKSAFDFIRNLDIIKISNNLGDSKSLITHPTTTTHQRLSQKERKSLGITNGMLRLSVGLEDIEDLELDIKTGLDCLSL